MSQASDVGDRDALLARHGPEEGQEEVDVAELAEGLEALQAQFESAIGELRADLKAIESSVAQEKRERRQAVDELDERLSQTRKEFSKPLNEIQDKLAGEDPTDPRASAYYEDLTLLEKYQRMPEAEREELLSSSKRRAVVIFEHWRDWASLVEAGWVITTRQTRDRKHGRSDIKSDLRAATGEDLQSVEIYRAMKQVAKLSAPDSDDVTVFEDEYDRIHITGGAFEFHEKSQRDTSRRFKVLSLVDEEAITLP